MACSAGRPLQPGLVTHFPRGAPQLAQLPNTAVPPLQDTPLQDTPWRRGGNNCWNGSELSIALFCSVRSARTRLRQTEGQSSNIVVDTATLQYGYAAARRRNRVQQLQCCSAPAPQRPRSPVRHGARWLVSREPPELPHHLLCHTRTNCLSVCNLPKKCLSI